MALRRETVRAALASLTGQERDLIALCERENAAVEGFRAPSEYLLAVGRKQA